MPLVGIQKSESSSRNQKTKRKIKDKDFEEEDLFYNTASGREGQDITLFDTVNDRASLDKSHSKALGHNSHRRLVNGKVSKIVHTTGGLKS